MSEAVRLNASQVVLLGADDLTTDGRSEFTEWELTVATWKRSPNRFGMRGFEAEHPDHKRVMTEIMGTAKDNPVRRGFLEKVRPNHYQLTPLGRAEASRLRGVKGGDSGQTTRSVSGLYDAVAVYADHRSFRSWLVDHDEPRSWLGASAFLHLKSHARIELLDKLRLPVATAKDAIRWCIENNRDQLTRGPVGGGRGIPAGELEKLIEFVDVLQNRFRAQIDAIKARKD